MRWVSNSLLVVVGLVGESRFAGAQVPTAAWPDDDAAVPVAPASTGTTPAQAAPPNDPAMVGAVPVAMRPPAANSPVSPQMQSRTTLGGDEQAGSIRETPSALVAASVPPVTGFSRLKIAPKEPGSTVYVFPYREDPEQLAVDSALMQCATSCAGDLPHGQYSIRVVTEEGVVSHGELTLRSARWVTAAPARQVVRDLGFVTGAVGALSTILGGALLADAICEKNCTESGRDTMGAVALGLGIPLVAVGWSLYFVHRRATVDEQVLTHETGRVQLKPIALQSSRGGVVGVEVQF